MRANPERDDGFTLIELLVVIIVIGILATIAIPSYLKQREKGYRAQAISDMRNVALAVETYATDDPTNSYAAVDGATEASPILTGQGFHPTEWVRILVHAAANSYCIEGVNQNVPGKVFVYRSDDGVVQIGLTGAITCT